jgi:hypothetical protein
MTRTRLSLALLAGIAALLGCERETPTMPANDPPPTPEYAIVDALHGSGGNPFFFFRWPLVSDPPSIPGTFDNTLLNELRVEIYALDNSGVPQGPSIKTLTSSAGSVLERIRMDARRGFYLVFWDTRQPQLHPDVHYQIQVHAGAQLLGTIDVDFVRRLRELANVDRNNYAGAVLGFPVPIPFTVQQGATTWLRLDRRGAIERVREELVDALAAEGFVVALATQEPVPPGTEIFQSNADPDDPPVMTAADEAFFVFVDLEPRQKYGHAVLYALVDVATGTVTVERATGVPSIGGEPLYLTLEERLFSPDRFEPESEDQVVASLTAERATRLHVHGPRFVLAAVSPAWTTVASAGNDPCRKVAVTVASGDDQYIKNDAQEFARVLRSNGFEVHEFDSAKDEIAAVLAGIQAAAEGLGPCDKFMIYISSHIGLEDENGDDLPDRTPLGIDYGDKGSDAKLFFQELTTILDDLTVGTINAVLDACFSEAWIAHMRAGLVLQPGVTLNVFTSSTSEKTSEGPARWNTIFNFRNILNPVSRYTGELIEQLDGANLDTDGDGQVSVPEFESGFRRAHDALAASLPQMPQSATFSGPAINQPPQATITTPQDGASFGAGQPIGFSGSATDSEDGTLAGGSLVWTSDKDGQIGTGTSFSRTLTAGTHVITLTATDGQGTTGTQRITIRVNDSPAVNLTQPAPNATFVVSQDIDFTATATDPDGLASILWTSDRDGQLGITTTFTRNDLSIGTHVITVTATDNLGATSSEQVTITVQPNQSPTVNITAPADGSTFSAGQTLTFTATATDPEDGDITHRIEWSSGTAGPLGTGGTIQAVLPPGQHSINAKATDSHGASFTDVIVITVQGTQPPIQLNDGKVGSNLQSFMTGTLAQAAPTGGVTIRITSSDPSRVLVSPNGTTPGAAAADVFVPQGQVNFSYFIQGVAGALGTASLDASTLGYGPGTANADVVQPAIRINNLPASTNTSAGDSPFHVQTGLPNAAGDDLDEAQSVSAGGSPVTVSVASSDANVAQIVTSAGAGQSGSVQIMPGQSTSQIVPTSAIHLRPQAAGMATIDANAFGFFFVNPFRIDVIETNTITIPSLRVGSGLMSDGIIGLLGTTAPTDLMVTIASGDPNRLLVSPNVFGAVGQASIQVPVAAGTDRFDFLIHGVEIQSGPVELTVTADGYSNTVVAQEIVAPTFQITRLPATGTPGAIIPFQVMTGIPALNGLDFGVGQRIRYAAAPRDVRLTSSNPVAGLLITQAGTGSTGIVQIQPGELLSPNFSFAGGVELRLGDASVIGQSTTISADILNFLRVRQSQGVVTVESFD